MATRFIMADESRVRLAGIDAPELSQPYGPESRAYLDKLVSGQDVTLQCNGEMSYNRRICNAFVNGLDLQRELVGWGLAFDYFQYSHGKYRSAEDFAYRMKRGVWSGGMRPWDYRRQQRRKSRKQNDEIGFSPLLNVDGVLYRLRSVLRPTTSQI